MVMREIGSEPAEAARPGEVPGSTSGIDARRSTESLPGLRNMPLSTLAAACREEIGRRRRGEPHSDAFAEELFHRAVCRRDESAWATIVELYRYLLTSWAVRHPAYTPGCVDPEDVAIQALSRFWMAVGPEQMPHFASINQLMKYLKMCVHSVMVNEARAVSAPAESPNEEHDVEALALDQVAATQLWSAIMRVLDDGLERLVIYLSFALGLKPGAIHTQHPDRFQSVAEVYQRKRNALDRLRRNPEILGYLAVA